MSLHPPPEHFQGKSVADHLRDARARGALASAEVHGAEMPGHLAAGADAARDLSIGLMLLWIVLLPFEPTLLQMIGVLAIFAVGFSIWKIARSALLGYARLERLHRVIEEERWEIEHHRPQEREELTEMYQAKGLQGKLLEETIDVLMADDNRLLRIMLEEELGLTLEVFEHPLKQAAGAGIGALSCSGLMIASLSLLPVIGLPLMSALVIAVTAAITAKLEWNRVLPFAIWSLSCAALCVGIVYFLAHLLS